jgi:hypothetical protein
MSEYIDRKAGLASQPATDIPLAKQHQAAKLDEALKGVSCNLARLGVKAGIMEEPKACAAINAQQREQHQAAGMDR